MGTVPKETASSPVTVEDYNDHHQGETVFGHLFHMISSSDNNNTTPDDGVDEIQDDDDHDVGGCSSGSSQKYFQMGNDDFDGDVLDEENHEESLSSSSSSSWYGQWLVPILLLLTVLPALLYLFQWLLHHWVVMETNTNSYHHDPIYVPTFVPGEGYVGLMDIVDEDY